LRDQSDASQFTFFSPGQAVAEAGAWTLFELVFGALSYPLTALLWMYVFGFRDKAWLVWGAVATTFGLSIVMDPMLEIASYHATRPDAMIAEWMVWTVYLIIALGLSSYYFVEALSIGPLKALLINSAVFAMILVGVVIAAVLLSLFFGIVILSGTEVPS